MLREGPIRKWLKERRERKHEISPQVKYTNVALADVRKGQAGPVEIRNTTDLPIIVEAFQSPITGQFIIYIRRVIMPWEREPKPEEYPEYEIVRRHSYLQPNIKPTL